MKRIAFVLLALLVLAGCQVVAPQPDAGKIAGLTTAADPNGTFPTIAVSKSLTARSGISKTAHVRVTAGGTSGQVMWDGKNSTFTNLNELSAGVTPIPLKGWGDISQSVVQDIDLSGSTGGTLFEPQPLNFDEFPMDPEKGYKIYATTLSITYFAIEMMYPDNIHVQQSIIVSPFTADELLASGAVGFSSPSSGVVEFHSVSTYFYQVFESGSALSYLDVPWDQPNIGHVYYFEFDTQYFDDVSNTFNTGAPVDWLHVIRYSKSI